MVRVAAWLVDVYTTTGVVLALLMVHCSTRARSAPPSGSSSRR